MDAGEKCGIVGARSTKNRDVVTKVLVALEALQHRGQESWGISVPGKPIFKKMGLATNWHLSAKELAHYKGTSGIGHVRYSTKGKSVLENAHPLRIGEAFDIAHNGTIVNADIMAAAVAGEFGISCGSDTAAVGYRLLHFLNESGSMFEAFTRVYPEVSGAYCLVILTKEGDVFAARDPRGYRPLSIGWHSTSKTFIAASESCALEAVGADFVRDVEPGEAVRFGANDGELQSHRFAPKVTPSHCSFEYTYFAHPSSRLNGVSVYQARKKVGRVLARKTGAKADVVIPVPDSARPSALGFALESGVPMDEGLMKDRYRRKGSIRSFIQPDQSEREAVVKKIIPIRDAINGRDVLIVDDSLVRGTSSRLIVKSLKKAGAKGVKMAVTFPAIRHPCFMGVDFPSRDELLAHRVAKGEADQAKTAKKVGEAIGVDEFYYNDIEGLAEAIGLPRESLCFSCVTGDYSKLGLNATSLPEEKVEAR